MSRLLYTLASQTALSAQTILLINASNQKVPDNLVFHSDSRKVDDWNGLGIWRPSRKQVGMWNAFMGMNNATSQGESIKKLPSIQYYWVGSKQKIMNAQSRTLAAQYSQNAWLAYFDDDDVMHRERVEFLWKAIRLEPGIDAIYHGCEHFKLDNEDKFWQLMGWWRDSNVSKSMNEDGKPHVNWREALQQSPFKQLNETCALVLGGRQPMVSTDADPSLLEGDTREHDEAMYNLYLNYAYPDSVDRWLPNLADQHVKEDNKTLTISMGWITVKKDIFRKVVAIDSDFDDNTYHYWRMNQLCRKTHFYFNVMGLYLKPYLYEY